MLSIKFIPPKRILEQLSERAKAIRLGQNLSRASLSLRSGVPVGTLKRFETTGKIGTEQLIAIAIALDCVEEIDLLFAPKPIVSIHQLAHTKRKRGTK